MTSNVSVEIRKVATERCNIDSPVRFRPARTGLWPHEGTIDDLDCDVPNRRIVQRSVAQSPSISTPPGTTAIVQAWHAQVRGATPVMGWDGTVSTASIGELEAELAAPLPGGVRNDE